jgi:hypothetical protein
MPARSELLDRCGDLKRELVAYAEHRRFRKEVERVLRDQLDPYDPDEAEVANAIDYFILQHRLPDGKTVLEHFVRDHPGLPAEERAVLVRWSEVVEGVFEVRRRSGDALIAVNLVDELEYRIVSNAGVEAIRELEKAAFVVTRIVPLEDEWMLSGMASLLEASERDQAYEMAAEIVLASPAALFRNPEKLAQAWQIHRKGREDFVALFGTDTLVVPGGELEEHMRRFAA